MKVDQEKIGLFIKNLRNELNMTQATLARKLNVTDRAVSKWERGKGLPDISLLEDLSSIFNVSILEILKGERLEHKEKETNILAMLKYAKEDKRNFIKRIVNFICLVIVILTGLVLLLKNIQSIYYQTKSYKLDYYTYYDYNLNDTYKAIIRDISLIRNNKGKFSDEDYERILSILEQFESALNYDLDKEIITKKSFTLEELSNYSKQQEMKFYPSDVEELIVLLLRYDASVYPNFRYISDEYLNLYKYTLLIDGNKKAYDYNFLKSQLGQENVSLLRGTIISKYDIIYLCLTNTKMVGDIHE